MGRADVDAYYGFAWPNRTSAMGQHHRIHSKLAQSLFGELVQYPWESFLPSVEL